MRAPKTDGQAVDEFLVRIDPQSVSDRLFQLAHTMRSKMYEDSEKHDTLTDRRLRKVHKAYKLISKAARKIRDIIDDGTSYPTEPMPSHTSMETVAHILRELKKAGWRLRRYKRSPYKEMKGACWAMESDTRDTMSVCKKRADAIREAYEVELQYRERQVGQRRG